MRFGDPQYWQRKPSRVSTFTRENFTERFIRLGVVLRRTTAGIFMVNDGERSSSSYESTTSTLSVKIMTMARSQAMTLWGTYDGESTSTRMGHLLSRCAPLDLDLDLDLDLESWCERRGLNSHGHSCPPVFEAVASA